jgi:hypothetical protein
MVWYNGPEQLKIERAVAVNPQMSNSKRTRIRCAGCNEIITVTSEMLDGAYACEKCGAAIDFTMYEPLAEELRQRAEARERMAADRKARERAEKESERQRREEQKELERQERERQREAKSASEAQNRQFQKELEASRTRAEQNQSQEKIPEYLAIQTVGVLVRIVGLVIAGLGIMGIVFFGLRYGGTSSAADLQLGIACAGFIIGGFLYIAIAEFMLAFRDMARNIADIRRELQEMRE